MEAVVTPILVRPRRSLVGAGLISTVLGMLPVFGVLYWVGIQHNTWMIVLVGHLLVVVASIITLFRQLSVFSAVSETELSGRGIFSPLERVKLDDIASVWIIATYVGQSPEPVQQLLVRDAAGRRLFRMRGNFWHAGDLVALAEALPVPTTRVKEPISITEFFRLYPGSAYWFEDKQSIRVAGLIGTLLFAVALTLWILAIFQ